MLYLFRLINIEKISDNKLSRKAFNPDGNKRPVNGNGPDISFGLKYLSN